MAVHLTSIKVVMVSPHTISPEINKITNINNPDIMPYIMPFFLIIFEVMYPQTKVPKEAITITIGSANLSGKVSARTNKKENSKSSKIQTTDPKITPIIEAFTAFDISLLSFDFS